MLTAPSVLVFGRDAVKNRYFSCTFYLENRHPKVPIILKFLTNGRRCHRFAINPSCGVVPPMSNLKVTILAREYDNFGQPFNNETVKKNRFTIVWQFIPNHKLEELIQFQSLKDMIKTIQEIGNYEKNSINEFVVLEDKDGNGNDQQRISGILGEGDAEINNGSFLRENMAKLVAQDQKKSMDIISSSQENQLQDQQEFDGYRYEASHLMSLATEHSIMEINSQMKSVRRFKGFLHIMLLVLLGCFIYKCIPPI